MRKVTLFFAAALFSLLSFAQDNNADIVKVGDSMPAFTLHSTVNGTVSSEDLKGKVVLINIFATWCGPCKMVAPILDELAKEYDGQIVIYKVDTEKEQELAGAFGIRSIPSILFIPMEGKPEMAQGAMPKASFKKAIDEFLLKK